MKPRMKLIRTAGFLLLLAVGAAAAFGWYEVRRGFGARATPSSIEVFAATTARKLAVPSSYRRLQNPLAATPENIQAGMEHFADHCATCHANDGSGDTMLGKGMYPKPPNMRRVETQSTSDGELYYTIENGVRLSGMPAFGEEHAASEDPETWHLVLFIRHLPSLTADELENMEQLNPKTLEERREEKEEEEFLNGGEPPKPTPGDMHHH
jgi:mono/diheme cytochrome c family protein